MKRHHHRAISIAGACACADNQSDAVYLHRQTPTRARKSAAAQNRLPQTTKPTRNQSDVPGGSDSTRAPQRVVSANTQTRAVLSIRIYACRKVHRSIQTGITEKCMSSPCGQQGPAVMREQGRFAGEAGLQFGRERRVGTSHGASCSGVRWALVQWPLAPFAGSATSRRACPFAAQRATQSADHEAHHGHGDGLDARTRHPHVAHKAAGHDTSN